ncbi:DUF4212 domain-containing protein [Paucibacter sp. APW11]|uniref:DUF4212 domain-containing protein n=1 Tax=Roseateles aquae TaxID=3077235 RepID=A0ABU3P7Z8_9BURK|nr:DUF4212 domain-containing protein [Paucibacter sp. APW11]MDT8998688.1 DUF4212 domain-containing protein [Paucibacter sp. APW11]
MEFPDLKPKTSFASLQRQHYWRRTCRLTVALLLIWSVVSFGLIYFARQLSFSFFGWPFSFWIASQGALLVYGLIVAYYAHAMRKLDQAYREGD